MQEKNKTIILNDDHINYLKEIKKIDNWTVAFWWESLQKKYPEIEEQTILKGSSCFGYGRLSTLDEAINNRCIILL